MYSLKLIQREIRNHLSMINKWLLTWCFRLILMKSRLKLMLNLFMKNWKNLDRLTKILDKLSNCSMQINLKVKSFLKQWLKHILPKQFIDKLDNLWKMETLIKFNTICLRSSFFKNSLAKNFVIKMVRSHFLEV